MKRIRINRSRWMRGQSPEKSSMLWSSRLQKGCCLGHAIHQISKCPWDSLNNLTSPRHYFDKESFLTERHGVGCSDNLFADDAMAINDDTSLSETAREVALTKLFKAHGYDLEFYG